MNGSLVLSILISFLIIYLPVEAVDRSKFRTCASTGFCKRFRDISVPATPVTSAARGPWVADSNSIHSNPVNNLFTVRLNQESPTGHHPGLYLEAQLYKNDAFRVRIVEDKERWQVPCFFFILFIYLNLSM